MNDERTGYEGTQPKETGEPNFGGTRPTENAKHGRISEAQQAQAGALLEIQGKDFSTELPDGNGKLSVHMILQSWPPESLVLGLEREATDTEGGVDDKVLYQRAELMAARMRKLEECVHIAASPGNAGANDYLRGMANGLILALHTMKGEDGDPSYIDPPTESNEENDAHEAQSPSDPDPRNES